MTSSSATTTIIVVVVVALGLFVIVPLLIATFYPICVLLTYAINHEMTWTTNLHAILKRLTMLCVAIGICTGLIYAWNDFLNDNDDDDNNNNNDNVWPIVLITLTTIVLSWISIRTSVWFVHDTRRTDVVGISNDKIPFYGPDSMKDRIVVVTGANSGVGKETTRQLASMGATVIMLCRSQTKAQEAIDDILSSSSSSSSSTKIRKDQLIFIPMDLSHFDSIRNAVKTIRTDVLGRSDDSDDDTTTTKNQQQFVDVLINNAGLMMGHQTLSKHDNLEMMMQANHLGHFLLTKLLIEGNLFDMNCSESNDSMTPRIINLTSSTYEFTNVHGGFDFDDMFCDQGIRPYTLFGQYSMTKLANILMIKELKRRYNTSSSSSCGLMKVYAVHPGIVRTNVTSHMQWYWQLPNTVFAVIVRTLQKTPTEGAYSTVLCAAAPETELPPNGSYIVNCKSHPTLPCANSVDDARRLWSVSEKLVGLGTDNSRGGNKEEEETSGWTDEKKTN